MFENDLYEYIYKISRTLQYLNSAKIALTNSRHFLPYKLFNAIDKTCKGWITPEDLSKFCSTRTKPSDIETFRILIIGININYQFSAEQREHLNYDCFLRFLNPNYETSLLKAIGNEAIAKSCINKALLTSVARFFAAAAETYHDIEDMKQTFIDNYGMCKNEAWRILRGSSLETKLDYSQVKNQLLKNNVIIEENAYKALIHYMYCKPGIHIDEDGLERIFLPFELSKVEYNSPKPFIEAEIMKTTANDIGCLGSQNQYRTYRSLKPLSLNTKIDYVNKTKGKRRVHDFFENYNNLVEKNKILDDYENRRHPTINPSYDTSNTKNILESNPIIHNTNKLQLKEVLKFMR